jgi:hypothetical protein
MKQGILLVNAATNWSKTSARTYDQAERVLSLNSGSLSTRARISFQSSTVPCRVTYQHLKKVHTKVNWYRRGERSTRNNNNNNNNQQQQQQQQPTTNNQQPTTNNQQPTTNNNNNNNNNQQQREKMEKMKKSKKWKKTNTLGSPQLKVIL